MKQDHFDRLFAEGSRDVLSGQHVVDVPAPAPSQRWGPSVCLRPCTDIAERLSGLTAASMEYAGQGHWPTGSTLSSHFTVRVLDHFVMVCIPRTLRSCATSMRSPARHLGPDRSGCGSLG